MNLEIRNNNDSTFTLINYDSKISNILPKQYHVSPSISNGLVQIINNNSNEVIALAPLSEIKVDGVVYNTLNDFISYVMPIINNESTNSGSGGNDSNIDEKLKGYVKSTYSNNNMFPKNPKTGDLVTFIDENNIPKEVYIFNGMNWDFIKQFGVNFKIKFSKDKFNSIKELDVFKQNVAPGLIVKEYKVNDVDNTIEAQITKDASSTVSLEGVEKFITLSKAYNLSIYIADEFLINSDESLEFREGNILDFSYMISKKDTILPKDITIANSNIITSANIRIEDIATNKINSISIIDNIGQEYFFISIYSKTDEIILENNSNLNRADIIYNFDEQYKAQKLSFKNTELSMLSIVGADLSSGTFEVPKFRNDNENTSKYITFNNCTFTENIINDIYNALLVPTILKDASSIIFEKTKPIFTNEQKQSLIDKGYNIEIIE